MHPLKKVVVFLVFLSCLSGMSQEASSFENIHLHLNKTTFFKGEHLWFKAYVKDSAMEGPSETTNLHVGIFTEDGQELVKKLVLISSGVGQGDITIDSTFVDKTYTVMAWSNYMKNFKKATPYLQKIKILGNPEKNSTPTNAGITIIARPEGQRLIPGVFNSVGVTLYTAAMRPLAIDDMQLVNSEGEIIQSGITTNLLGQGRFGFFVEPNQSYLLEVRDGDGNWARQKLEVDTAAKITLGVENRAKDAVVFRPRCAAENVPSLTKSRYTLAIFHDQTMVYSQEYDFAPTPALISVSREAIPEGLNTATILDEDLQPITQRMFFNRLEARKRVHEVSLEYRLTPNQDSLKIRIRLPEGDSTANLSMSFLPTRTTAYMPNNSIASSLLIQPYLEEHLVDGGYFFTGSKRSSAYQMDTRLLMEGTARFDPIQPGAPELLYKQQRWIPIKGKIIDADTEKEKQVSVFSRSLGSMNFLELTSNKDFQGNLPVFKGDSLLISVLNAKGKLRKPKAELYTNRRPEPLFNYDTWLQKARDLTTEVGDPELEENLNLSDRAIVLEEVLLSAPKKRPTKFQITTEIQGRIIDSATMRRNPTVINYIRKLGFQTRPNQNGDGIGVFVFDPPGLAPVPVTMEGMLVSAGELMNLPLSSVQSLVYNRLVTPHQGPFIALTLRYDFDGLSGRGNFAPLQITEGFDKSQVYFNPIYPDYDSLLYKKYGAIWWEPQVIANSETPTIITIPLNQQKSFMVFVEGMSDSGLLYQSEHLLKPFEVNEAGN